MAPAFLADTADAQQVAALKMAQAQSRLARKAAG
jgi:hypothetical protein